MIGNNGFYLPLRVRYTNCPDTGAERSTVDLSYLLSGF
jgi:hypothetical protein